MVCTKLNRCWKKLELKINSLLNRRDSYEHELDPKANAYITDTYAIRVTDNKPRVLSSGGVSAWGRYVYAEPGENGVLRKENGEPFLSIGWGVVGFANPAVGCESEVACITETKGFICNATRI